MTELYHKRAGKNRGARNIALGLACALGGLNWAAPVSADTPPVAPITTAPAPPISAADRHQADAEGKEGSDAAADLAKQLKLVTDPAVLARVNAIGQKLAAVADTTTVPAEFGNDHAYPFTYHFFVVQSKDVNAFSLPGGYVYVNTGLLDAVRSDDELAGVLGHEITHAAHHHIAAISHIANTKFGLLNVATILATLASVLSRNGGNNVGAIAEAGQYYQLGVLNNEYSEQAERDADHGGTILMQKAGFNPVGMLTFMERLGDFEDRSAQINEGIFQNHPAAAERTALLRSELDQMHVPVTAKTVRLVSGGFRATVSPDNDGARQVLFNKAPLATLADHDGARAQAAAALLNDLLDGGLQLYQVDVKDNVLVAADRPLLTFTPADAALSPGATPASLAAQSAQALRRGLYAQSFVVSQPSL